jgi:hypothetical protein
MRSFVTCILTPNNTGFPETFITVLTKCPQVVPVVSQMNPVHTVSLYFLVVVYFEDLLEIWAFLL